jgi:cardiolipin synthase
MTESTLRLLRPALALGRLAAAACWLLAAAGCASLPDAREATTPRAQAVELEGARGPVSAGKSAAIIGNLQNKTGDTDILQKHLAVEQAINLDSPLVLGNKLTLLQDGPATYQAMFAAMRAARDHINLETYIFEDDDIGRQFADLLLARQAAGVQVNVIYDSVGSLHTPREFFDRLRAGGRAQEAMGAEPPRPPQAAGGRRPRRLRRRRQHQRSLFDRFVDMVGAQSGRGDRGLARHPPGDRRAGGGGVPEAVPRALEHAEGPAAGREELLPQTPQAG